MSYRSTLELTVRVLAGEPGHHGLFRPAVEAFAWATPWEPQIVESGDYLDTSVDVLKWNKDGSGFYMIIFNAHPEDVTDPLVAMSTAHPELLLEVEEFIHEKTEVVEPGRTIYRLKNGVRIKPAEEFQRDVVALLTSLDAMADPALSDKNHLSVAGVLHNELVGRLRKYVSENPLPGRPA